MVAALLGGLLLLLAPACRPPGPPPATPAPLPTRLIPTGELPPATPSAARGQPIYADLCARCHGASGRGDAPLARPMRPRPADFTDLELMRQASPARFWFSIRDGVFGSAMEGYQDRLDTQQRWDVLFYLWQFPATREQIRRGEEIWRARCRDCPQPPGVYQMSRRQLFDSLPLEDVPDADRWAVVEYLWTLFYEPHVPGGE